ncbi:tagaturonate reductase [Cohnella sp. CFH 77786]|uniref:tagaturonate reductase n=1 Tax=Cohnella sp. CFH 77786 TaxID=2662265 RepID=UPI001C60E03B|nr:tagaturonate reductase [Cohnella sp. CFH 77786]MBW5449084.1 tagaturonate reductase [Cohnella sp. CFH 77786]
MKTLNRGVLQEAERRQLDAALSSPVKILQIGEGNFLRGFADWMVQVCRNRGLFDGSVAVTQPRPSGRGNIVKLAAQEGIYTLVTRGLENGAPVERKEIVSVFSEVFDPYSEWERLVSIALSADLRFVISNTTEAGLAYVPEPLTGGPIASFPGKIAYLLHRRFTAREGASGGGLIFLPCELLERNGDALRDAVLRYASDWGFGEAFETWVVEHNRFLNSLVDRIVTGYPDEAQAEAWFAEWGYRDAMLNTAEPYHLWAIEGEPELDALLPFRQAGLNVVWTDDLTPYQRRKVRILNGAHTWMAPLGLLHGVEHVRELLEHAELGPKVRETVFGEIVPTLPDSRQEMEAYAATVFERFGNPYIRHRLADIAMNSLSKFRTRLLPTFASYAERGEAIPARLALGLSGLLRYYRVERDESGRYSGVTLRGERYAVRDDAASLDRIAGVWEEAGRSGETIAWAVRKLLSDERLWGRELSAWNGLAEAVAEQLAEWERGAGK